MGRRFVLDDHVERGSTNLDLAIRQFKCIVNPLIKKQVCGADAEGTFNRAQFGVNAGQAFGFDMTVRLRIQVEGVRVD